jgi:hypothetical protein
MNIDSSVTVPKQALALVAAFIAFGMQNVRADAVTEWNVRAGEFVVAAGLITQPASRVMAISHTAAFEAANAITKRFPSAGE